MTPLQLSTVLTHKNYWVITHMVTPASKDGKNTFHIEGGRTIAGIHYILTIQGTETCAEASETSLAYDFSRFQITMKKIYSVGEEMTSDSFSKNDLSNLKLMCLIESPWRQL